MVLLPLPGRYLGSSEWRGMLVGCSHPGCFMRVGTDLASPWRKHHFIILGKKRLVYEVAAVCLQIAPGSAGCRRSLPQICMFEPGIHELKPGQ